MGVGVDAEIVSGILTSKVFLSVCLSQYLKMRFGRGMQLLGSIQFIVATVRHTSQCSQIFCIFSRQRRILCSYADNFQHGS